MTDSPSRGCVKVTLSLEASEADCHLTGDQSVPQFFR